MRTGGLSVEITNIRTAVIGGGPSGYCAAIACARATGRGSVMILEKQPRTGRKLLATGNGRCNISNENVSPEHYHGDRVIAESVLRSFSVSDMKDFFGSLGVLLRSDQEGRIYPCSNQAVTILDGLKRECSALGVIERCSFMPRSIKKDKNGFLITSDDAQVHCQRLVLAAGSKAAPQLGADGSGYALLKGLNIRCSELFPALCPVSTAEKYKALKGVRAKGRVTLLSDGRPVAGTEGEIQFTDGGISGICVFELSRKVNGFFLDGKVDGAICKRIQIAADVMSGIGFNELCGYLEGCRRVFYNDKAGELLSGALNVQLSRVIAKACALSDKSCGELGSRDIKQLAACAKKLIFTPDRMGEFGSAQVCAGGVGSDEIDPHTLMSRTHKGLFICGEMLDVDGDCGGFNLHFAVGSGLMAGRSASAGQIGLHY